jgi:hypothetical protein
MGKRGQKHTKKAATGGPPSDPLDILGSLIRPIAPNKRHELNQLVDKLFELASNFGHDAVTPKQLWEEHLKIRALVEKAREMEQCNLNRRLLGARRSHMPTLLEWLQKYGAQMDGVEVADFGPEEGKVGGFACV